MLIWAACFYSFAGLLPHWEADLGWTRAELAAGLTIALLTSAVTAPFAGRLVDRGHARALMTGGALLGAASLVLLSTVTVRPVFYLCWALIGLTKSASLYEPCFAVITRHLGADAGRAIVIVTLFGGFASTLAFPTAHLMVAWSGWRLAAWWFAGLAVAAAALMAWSIGPDKPHFDEAEPEAGSSAGLARVIGNPVFWLLGCCAAMTTMNHDGLMAHVLPLFADRGLAPGTAVVVASLVGPMQVVGRVAMVAAGSQVPAAAVAVTACIGTALAAVVLLLAGLAPTWVLLFVVLQGAAYGTTSIARPLITAAWLGRRDYGAISGALAIPLTLGSALAPSLMAWIEGIAGYDAVIMTACGCSLVGLIATIAAWRLAATPTAVTT